MAAAAAMRRAETRPSLMRNHELAQLRPVLALPATVPVAAVRVMRRVAITAHANLAKNLGMAFALPFSPCGAGAAQGCTQLSPA